MSWDALGTSSGGGGGFKDGFILPAGRFKVGIIQAGIVERKKYQSEETEEQFEIVFKTLAPFTEELAEELEIEDGEGKHGYISNWIRQADYQLEDPKDGNKSGITAFLDDFFGRKLTEDEIPQFSILNFAKRIIGVEGVVIVGVSKTGKPKFNRFKPNKELNPKPADYYRGGKLQQKSAATSATAKTTGAKTKPAPKDGELPDDPFADE